MQALIMGVWQMWSVKPSLQVQLKSTVFPLVIARHVPPFMHGEVVHGSWNWHLLPRYPSVHLKKGKYFICSGFAATGTLVKTRIFIKINKDKLVPSRCFTTWQHNQGTLCFKTGHSSLKPCVGAAKSNGLRNRGRVPVMFLTGGVWIVNIGLVQSGDWDRKWAFARHLDAFTSTVRTDDGHCIHTLTDRFYTDIHKGYKINLTWSWTL